MSLLTVTVSVIPRHLRKSMFFGALYVLSVGLAGHKPCVQAFAADQFSEDSAEERKAKSSFFNWWYMGIVVGANTAVLVVIYIQVQRHGIKLVRETTFSWIQQIRFQWTKIRVAFEVRSSPIFTRANKHRKFSFSDIKHCLIDLSGNLSFKTGTFGIKNVYSTHKKNMDHATIV